MMENLGENRDRISVLPFIPAILVVYLVGLCVYRFFFHPLAKIPGPPLAIATYVYEWYYDIWHQGSYTYKLKALHERYGPVIRINPDEVHIFDHEYYDEVFNNSNGRVDKPKHIAEVFGPYPAGVGTTSHDLHKIRRNAVNAFFSKASVTELVPSILRPLNLLLERLQTASRTGEIMNMRYFFAAVTLDVMTDYCFAMDAANVLMEDFNGKTFDDLEGFVGAAFVNINLPWLVRPIYYLPVCPSSVFIQYTRWSNSHKTGLVSEDPVSFNDWYARIPTDQVEAIRKGDNDAYKTAKHKTIFHELLSNGKLPPSELARDRIRDEAFALMTAGSGTTAQVLRGTAYHIAANRDIHKRLFAELKSAIPNPIEIPPLRELEKLEYLMAIIQEGLRIGDPVLHRLGRQFPDKAFVHPSGVTIPAGTTVFMTSFSMLHENPRIFPEPHIFRPERWLGSEGKKLEKYLAPFSRGTRNCVGINLARAELAIILAATFRRFDFDVSAVDRRRDVDYTRNLWLGATAKDSPGILVRVKTAE